MLCHTKGCVKDALEFRGIIPKSKKSINMLLFYIDVVQIYLL